MLLPLHSWSRYLQRAPSALARRRNKERRRTVRLELERLETRWLLSSGITEATGRSATTASAGAGPRCSAGRCRARGGARPRPQAGGRYSYDPSGSKVST
jgi:hypothetical protein